MTPRATSRAIIAGACMLAGLGVIGTASAEEVLREVYFHDLAKTRVGNMIIEVLDGLAKSGDEGNSAVEADVKKRAVALCERFPIYR